MTWIQTYSGIAVNVYNPTLESISIHDIAHALSHQCRYTGHVRRFYSVAQHSLLASKFVLNPDNALAALMHDASEAYITDIATPVKQAISGYYELERTFMQIIADKFGFTYPFDPEIKIVDMRLLNTERYQLLGKSPQPWESEIESAGFYEGYHIPYMSPYKAKNAFLKRAQQLGIIL